MDKRHHAFWGAFSALSVLLLTALIYFPGLSGPFIFDDYPNIVNNKLLWGNFEEPWDLGTLRVAAFSSGSGLLQRPISMASFALNLLLFGQGPYSFKAANLAIHLINGLILGAFLILLFNAYRKRWATNLDSSLSYGIALAIAAAWLVLPINLTAVLYIVQRMTSLSALFSLLALICYVRGRIRLLAGQIAYPFIILGVVFFGVLSVFSKESGALLPIYMLVIEVTIFRFKNKKNQYDKLLLSSYFLLLVVPCLAGLIWITANGIFSAYEGRLFNLPQRLFTEIRVLLLYIKWILLPSPQDLSLYHDDIIISQDLFSPPSTFFCLLAILGLLVVAFKQYNQRPLITLGIFWFFGGHLMESTIIPLELIFEHRNYLPSIGLLIAILPLLITEVPSGISRVIRLSIIGIIITYSCITWLRANDWQSIVDLTAQEAYRNPDSPRVAYDLGKLYGNLVTSANSEYVPLAYNALEHAAELKDSSILPDAALIVLSYKIKRSIDLRWYERMENKLRTQPITFADISALEGLIKCAILKGCLLENDRVMRIFAAALESPRLANRPRIQALLLSQYTNYLTNVLGYFELAKEITIQLIALSPTDLPYRLNLIRLLLALKDKPAALKELEELQKADHQKLFSKDIEQLQRQIYTDE